jgi:hypothetical protein
MKGRKGSTDEGGVRSPLLIAWPGKIKGGGLILQICSVMDLLPTLTDLAGVPLLGEHPLDGVSLEPLLTGKSGALPDRLIFSHWNGKVSVRTQHFRLDHQGELFDMVNDPGQTKAITVQQPAVAAELQAQVDEWKNALLPGLKDDQRPFPIGHPAFPVTQLPARDGVPHGEIRRSQRAPNCSYFTNWSSTTDSMTWPVDVLASGNFEVEMYYTCPAALVGSEIELSLGSSRVRGVITMENDPPARGAEQDRVKRVSESYVKEFKPLNLGVVRLEQGPGELSLRATQLAGPEGTLEMRLLMFHRVK